MKLNCFFVMVDYHFTVFKSVSFIVNALFLYKHIYAHLNITNYMCQDLPSIYRWRSFFYIHMLLFSFLSFLLSCWLVSSVVESCFYCLPFFFFFFEKIKNDHHENRILTQGNRITPSYIAFTPEGERLIGDAAKNQLISNPESKLSVSLSFLSINHIYIFRYCFWC